MGLNLKANDAALNKITPLTTFFLVLNVKNRGSNSTFPLPSALEERGGCVKTSSTGHGVKREWG